ncbi:MAG: CarboxypepD reg-like domain, partial [Verrucomicrobiota bacterium]
MTRVPLAFLCVLLVVSAGIAPDGRAAGATGMIEGRIFNPGTGEYLEFVRVTVDGTSLETFTDSAGEFRLARQPALAVAVERA